MTSCDGKAGLQRLVFKKNERPAAAPRITAPTSASVFPVSAVALAVALFAASPQARAANECTPDPSAANTVNCGAASYPGGITYTVGTALTLNLNNPAMVIEGTGLSVTQPNGLGTPSM